MSSSQQPSNNSNNNNNSTYPNQLLDYETDESLDSQRYSQQQISGHLFDNRNPSDGNDLFQQIYPFQEDVDEDLPDEIVAELDARDRIRSNINDEDESVFSDVVQDAFKKYQNEYSKYWTYNDTIWDNRLSDEEIFDDEQEELYAQMEECWNYMAQDSPPVDQSKAPTGQTPSSKLNPDANEFKPSWLPSSSSSILTNAGLPISMQSSPPDEHQKKL